MTGKPEGDTSPDGAPRARRRRLPAAERRAEIVGAALEVFSREGYEKATTAAVAAEAGCSEAALYRHFPSKLAILAGALERIRQEVIEDSLPPGPPPPLDGLVALLLDSAPARRNIRVLVSAIAVAHRDEEVGAALAEAFAATRQALVDAMLGLRAAGGLRDDVSAEDAAWMIQGLVLSGLLRRSVRDDGVADGVVPATATLRRLLAPT